MIVHVVIGEHQLGLGVSELGADKFVIHVFDLDPHPLHVKKGIVAFLAQDVTGNPVAVFAGGVATKGFNRLHHLLRGDLGAWVGAGSVPVVDPGSPGTAPYHGSLVNNDDLCPPSGGIYRCVAPGDAATENQDIGTDFVLLTVIYRVWPLNYFA